MADPLSITASIVAVLQAAQTVVQYLKDVKTGSGDRIRLLDEIRSTSAVLETLKDFGEDEETREEWQASFKSIAVEGGPLDQLKDIFKLLQAKLEVGKGKVGRMVHALQWPFDKKDVQEYMRAIDRQKTLLTLARQNDHINLSREIRSGVNDVQDTLRLILMGGNLSDVQRNDGETLLTVAALHGHLDVVELLLKMNVAEVNAGNKNRRTALMCAAEKCHEAVLDRLLATGKADVNAVDINGRTALLYMALFGPSDAVGIVDRLLATGKIHVDHRDIHGNTAMIHAAFKSKSDTVTRLLATGEADINSIDMFGRSAILIMALGGPPGCEKMLDQLLNTGSVNVNLKDKDGETAITHAAYSGRLEFVKRLLADERIDIDIKDNDGHTALMFAARTGREAVVAILLSRGANVVVKDKDGLNARAQSQIGGHKAVIARLEAAER